MVRLSIKTATQLLNLLCILLLSVLATSCGTSDISSAGQTLLEQPLNILPGQAVEWPAGGREFPFGQDLRFEKISVEQGLSQSTVFCILQDQEGFIWFGTEDGLNKYDGYTFTIYKHDSEDPNSLSANWVQVLFEDKKGVLWIGTIDGLDRFDPETNTFAHFRNDPNDPTSLSNNNITAVIQDHDGALWIGTDGGGLNRLDQDQAGFDHFQHDPDNPNGISSNSVSAIYEDSEGVLWVGTSDAGLNRFESKEKQWKHYLNDPETSNSLSHNNVSAIAEDREGVLWIGTDGGGLNKLVLTDEVKNNISADEEQIQENVHFQYYQHHPNDLSSLSSNDVSAIYLDPVGLLWVGTRTGGINLMNAELDTFTSYKNIPGVPDSLGNDWILSIFQDREGVNWFGTIGGGVYKLNLGWRNFALFNNIPNNPNSLGDNMVRTFFQENESTLWVGTMFGGLDKFDRKTGDWKHYLSDPESSNSLSDNFVSVIYMDRSNKLWLGTASGLDEFHPETETFTLHQIESNSPPGSPENNIRAIYESPEGVFWIGTMRGLYLYEPEDDRWQGFDHSIPDDDHNLSTYWIVSILEDNEGMLWVGTWGAGLFRIDLETELVTHYHHDSNDSSSLSSDILLKGTQAQNGLIWFGTVSGLEAYDISSDTFTHYGKKDGLPNDVVYCAIEDEGGFLWVSTNKGLSKFDPQRGTFRNYEMIDGIQSDEFNGGACMVGENGELFFGGINGFNTINPDQVMDNPYIPPVVITSITHDGVEADRVSIGEGITEVTLNWPHNAFEFEYAALSFNQPNKNLYAYYLEGFEDTWNEVGTRRYGQFTNLPGGTYILRVKGSNNDGVWNEIGASMKITITPPFWATWWFQSIVAVVVLGIAYGGYRLRVKNIETRSSDLEKQVEDRTAELQREIDQRMQIEEALRKSEMEKAVSDERSRLARELHDSVTQSLYSLTLFTEAARHTAEESGNDEIEQYVRQIGAIGLHALKEMRLLVFELRPPELEKEGLLSAIRKRLEAVEGRAGVDARLVVDDYVRLPGEVEQEFFRIAQEALNNSLKHAEASYVIVYLRQKNNCVEMEVVDDGVGFNPDALTDGGGMGLNNIQERAEGLGGILSIQSEPGKGTRIKLVIKDNDDWESMDAKGEIDE